MVRSALCLQLSRLMPFLALYASRYLNYAPSR